MLERINGFILGQILVFKRKVNVCCLAKWLCVTCPVRISCGALWFSLVGRVLRTLLGLHNVTAAVLKFN